VQELNRLILGLAGVPRNEPHATGPFKLALQGLGTLGGDRGTLMAFRTNELQVRMKYQSYAAKAKFWPREVHAVIDRNALDEERHYRWVTQALQAMGTGAPSARERAREFGGVAATLSADALERAAARLGTIADAQAAQGGARARAADAAQRLAGGMGATAGFLRDPDPQELRETVEHQVRTQPFAVLATTFAAGFIIGRILR
jgi:hypothetical protein